MIFIDLQFNKKYYFITSFCFIISSLIIIGFEIYHYFVNNISIAYDTLIYYLLLLILGIILFFKNNKKIMPYMLIFLSLISLYWFIDGYTFLFEEFDTIIEYFNIYFTSFLGLIIGLLYFVSPFLLFIQIIINNKNSVFSRSWFISGILEIIALFLNAIVYFKLNYTSIDFLLLLITEIPCCIGIFLLGFLIYNNKTIINDNIELLNNKKSETFILLQKRLKTDMLIVLIFQIINVGLSFFENTLNIVIVINLILVSFGYFESKKGTKSAGIIGIVIGILMLINILKFEIIDFMLGLFILIRAIKYTNEFSQSLKS